MYNLSYNSVSNTNEFDSYRKNRLHGNECSKVEIEQ